jgi:hypothetical protein
MKPKPLVGLKNFTVPVVDMMSSRGGVAARDSARGIKLLVGEDRKNQPETNRRQTQSAFDPRIMRLKRPQ